MLAAWRALGTAYVEYSYPVPAADPPWSAVNINVDQFDYPFPLLGVDFRLTGYFDDEDPTKSTAGVHNKDLSAGTFDTTITATVVATFEVNPVPAGTDQMSATPTFTDLDKNLAGYTAPVDYLPNDGVTYYPSSSATTTQVGTDADEEFFNFAYGGDGTRTITFTAPAEASMLVDPGGKAYDALQQVFLGATFVVRYYIPEPAGLTVLGIGAAALLVRRRRT